MSGVACATPVTPSLPSSRLSARLPVGEWLPRADGTSRQEDSRTYIVITYSLYSCWGFVFM